MTSDHPQQPLRSRRYRLARTDALAYERLPGEISARTKLVLIIWLALPGFVAGLIADEVSGTLWWALLAGLVVFAIGTAIVTAKVMDHRRAARHPIPDGEVRLEEWGDHLAEFAAGESRFVAMEMIGKVIVTPSHVFVCEKRFPVIVPRAAFEDDQDMRSFASWLDEASAQAQP